jgi:hypothetical protein
LAEIVSDRRDELTGDNQSRGSREVDVTSIRAEKI